MNDAANWLAADHAGQIRAGDLPCGEREPLPERRPRSDLSCDQCGAAFEVDCGCPYHTLQPGFWESAARAVREGRRR